MDEQDFYLQPEFAKPRKNKNKVKRNNVPQKQQKGFVETVKENKILVLVFAIVIILLITVIVWMIFKQDDKTAPETARPPDPPVPPVQPQRPPQQPQPPNAQKPPTQPSAAQRPPAQPRPPQPQPQPTKIKNTVDDDELNNYMNIVDESSSEDSSSEESSDESPIKKYKDADEFADLDKYD